MAIIGNGAVIIPDFLSVAEGDPIVLLCPTLQRIRWYHNMEALSEDNIVREKAQEFHRFTNVEAVVTSVSIQKADFDDAGIYTCRGYSADGVITKLSSVVEVVSE